MEVAFKVLSVLMWPSFLLCWWGALAIGWRAMQLRPQRSLLSKALFGRALLFFTLGLLMLHLAIVGLEGEFSIYATAWGAVVGIAVIVSAVLYSQWENSEAQPYLRVEFKNVLLFRACVTS